ncbi:hypothetical protein HN51_017829 [Arachis hypogaea]|uniref:kinesin-like protein KIN-7J n=1 Tax=Arachis hypogaea TaxID=3818 RepID=UPI000DEC530E|nr:kinesin-like protein KIN-7E [Arachis hypogaea]
MAKMREPGSETPTSNCEEEKIFVSIRVRPLNDRERWRRDASEWECISGNTIRYKNGPTDGYTFDRVYGEKSSTQQVYEQGIKEIVLSVVSGINCSVFAYGQTSSGKTYTMKGITEYAIDDIYDYIEKQHGRDYIMKFSAMEIYNEAVKDLLIANSPPLRLLDDPEKGTIVERLTEETLTERSHLQELLSTCAAHRTTEETAMNETSSRSHQILRLTVESNPTDYVGTTRSGTLIASVNFVDLAGSERASQALSAGTRLREGSHINRSLLTLGTVIRKLSKERNGHIPYRDSKLTRILQNSLGGNARTAIICTISPARSQVEQSKNTLLFAATAKQVTTNAKVNVVMSDKVLVQQLQKELARMENELKGFSSNSAILKERELLIEQMEQKIKELTEQRDLFQSRVENLLQTNTQVETPRHRRRTSSVSNLTAKLLQHQENMEDDFLLDGSPPTFAGPDPCHGWEEISREAGSEDSIREVQCVDTSLHALKQSGGNTPMIQVTHVVTKSSSRNDHKGLDHVAELNSQDFLKQTVQNTEKTNEPCHVEDLSEYPNESPYISCKPMLAAYATPMSPAAQIIKVDWEPASLHHAKRLQQKVMSYSSPSWLGKFDQEFASPSRFAGLQQTPTRVEQEYSDCLDYLPEEPYKSPMQVTTRKSSRKYSQIGETNAPVPVESDVDSDGEDTASVLNFAVRMNEKSRSKLSKKNSNDQLVHGKSYVVNKRLSKIKGMGFYECAGAMTPSRFERQQKDIVELWHACNVPLVHRSYFFLLIKGELADTVYLDVELRRLSFLQHTFSTGADITGQGLDVTPNSSLKALNRERKMLSKQVHKKFSYKERLQLYQRWGIDLNTKHRSIQLAYLLWTNTELNHARESATLVARLVGLIDSGDDSKKSFGFGFGFGFLARRKSSTVKPDNWKENMTTVG